MLYRWWRMTIVGSVDHEEVVDRIIGESGWTPRYAFMVMMSAGIAVLGLLLSSPAVVIGAMLISPLMNPILGLGFSLTLFDYAELRRSLIALAIGSAAAVLFTALIVLLSPLKAPTAEILSRTRPNLFDLAVALFAALAGTFAVIRGRGETIVGVAIATALMPPLAVVGYGLATWNVPVLAGSLALYVTNFVTIALSSMVMARFYGFGHNLSSQQGWLQTVVLVLVFVAMAVPLGFSLTQIAREAYTVSSVRAFLSDEFGSQARVTQLDVDFEAAPIAVRAVVIAPRARAVPAPEVRTALQKKLGRSVTLQLDEVLLDPGASTLEAQKTELQATDTTEVDRKVAALVQLVAVTAGVATDQVTLDRGNQRIEARSVALPGATLATYRSLEDRVRASAGGWTVTIVPPLQPLPVISFAGDADTLDDATKQAVALSAWAASRWNSPALGIPGLPKGDPPDHPTLPQRRALAVADAAKAAGAAVAPLPAAAGPAFQLSLMAP
ncbi:DUF389 domain-containing protein [Sphingomonas sp.]|jgi:uncharacterized hydrophobic protein (TIGR00271 family)|uniref:DUF389 domain-containing protein n=1 Tax=Sphingomonas sp. TaxID=28214 RepID=UPI002E327E4C|nr:DUF389 domain-containing protein [Sphingomonas sp.]HEX4693390.1 DUF389 domain-containing protein [Sphingomonas sp.]